MSKNKINDIVYACLAHLSYLDWRGYERDTDITDILFGEDPLISNIKPLMKTSDKASIIAYSEDYEYNEPKWIEHMDWKFLKAMSDEDIMHDLFGFKDETYEGNGFYGVAFVNHNIKKVIIAFRGTDDLEDMIADLNIAFFNRYHPQVLHAHWFLRNIKKVISTFNYASAYTIDFVGHSLGGALAQYAHVMNGNVGRTVTFNALGAGVYFNKKNSRFNIINSIAIYALKNLDVNYNNKTIGVLMDLYSSNDIVNDTSVSYDKLYQHLISLADKKRNGIEFSLKNLKIRLGARVDREEEGFDIKPDDIKKIKRATIELIGMIKAIRLYGDTLDKYDNLEKFNIDNYVFKNDWVINLQTHIGKCYDVTNPNGNHNNDINDSPWRVIKHTLSRFGFVKHSTGNFIRYIDDSGNITCGKMRKVIADQLMRHVLLIASRDLTIGKYLNHEERDVMTIPESKLHLIDTASLAKNKDVQSWIEAEEKGYSSEIYNVLSNYKYQEVYDNDTKCYYIGGYNNLNSFVAKVPGIRQMLIKILKGE